MGLFKRKEPGLVESAAKGKLSVVESLLKRGIDPDVRDLGGSETTALFVAAANGHDNVVKALLEAGANANAAADKSDITALMLAALRGNADVVLTLLKAGADANAQDDQGETALMFAIRGIKYLPEPHSEPHIRLQRVVIKTLLAFGADPKKKVWGKTVLDDPTLIGDEETKRLLESFCA